MTSKLNNIAKIFSSLNNRSKIDLSKLNGEKIWIRVSKYC